MIWHLDLFSGIGGFSIASDAVWGDVEHTFVEYDPFPQAVLKKHWPYAEIHGDIRAFIADAKSARQRTERTLSRKGAITRSSNTDATRQVFLLTGGFPAGRRKGTADDNGNGDALPCGERCDIIGVCNGDTTISVRDAGNSRGEGKEAATANPVRPSTKRSGEQRTPTNEGEPKTSGRENGSARFTNDMEGNASVAERATSLSSQSTTRTEGETRSDGSTTAKRGNSSSKTDTQRHTKSSATTATTRSTTSEPVLINGERVFLLTGGFPCQPFSHAGRRKGTSDDRYLWPQMYECIKLYRPRWVIAENVRGLATWNDGLVLETVCADLEKEGYEVQPIIIPACAVGAPHRRDRVWIIAHNATDFERERLERSGEQPELSQPTTDTRHIQWREDWPEAATRLCAVDDGLPGGLARPRGWRNAALKAAGNAIVPQVAEMIMRAIKEADV